MESKESLMYRLMSELSKSNIPIVFKGGLVTKILFQQYSPTEYDRMTKDIDANWEDLIEKPSADKIADVITHEIKK